MRLNLSFNDRSLMGEINDFITSLGSLPGLGVPHWVNVVSEILIGSSGLISRISPFTPSTPPYTADRCSHTWTHQNAESGYRAPSGSSLMARSTYLG
jgi:hypothetical protein